MIRILLSGFFIIVLSCCSINKPKDKNIEIVIEDAQSYRYDLVNEMFAVLNWNKPNIEVKFHLSNEERNKIINHYYALKLDELNTIDTTTGNIYIEDECMDMPKPFTLLHVKTSDKAQKIQIDMGCDNFYFYNFR